MANPQHLDGTPLPAAVAARVACDASVVVHGDPLYLGRKTREWSTAQRRAISVRDGGVCRFPGCDLRICDVHHLVHWTRGGPTDVSNGALLCTRHHTLLHDGYSTTGDAGGPIAWYRPDGRFIATTAPLRSGDRLAPVA